MLHTWTHVGLPALLAAAVAASPTLGQFDGDPDKADAILSQLKTVNTTLKELEGLKSLPRTVTDLEKKIGDLEKKLSEQLTNQDINLGLRIQSLKSEVTTLREQHAQLKQEIEALRNRTGTRQPTTSLYPPPNGTATGRILLVNTYPEEVSIVVNDRPAYRIPPGDRMWVESVPAGQFTYEVLGIQGRVRRGLTAGETFTIHVYPR